MRKILISILVIILFTIAGYMCLTGITIINFQVWGFKQIKAENEKLDSSISIASKLISTDYPTEVSNLSKSLKDLQTEKENYKNLVNISNENDLQSVSKIKKFEIEYLWTQIGKHARKEGVTMKIDLKNSSTGTQGLYDLQFTVTGLYIGIADFIYNIENDGSLGFKIEDFKLVSGGVSDDKDDNNSNILTGTFNCKDIGINIDTSNISTSTQYSSDIDNSNTTNTTNTTTNSTRTTTENTTNTIQ